MKIKKLKIKLKKIKIDKIKSLRTYFGKALVLRLVPKTKVQRIYCITFIFYLSFSS